MNTEKEEKLQENNIEEWIGNIKLQSPLPSEKHSAEKSFSRLLARIQTDCSSVDVFRRRAHRYQWWLAAATVALLIAMTGWLYATVEGNPTFVVTSNNTGIVQDVLLPDGTSIKLNNHSKLFYPERFTSSTREVFLEGEAYFDVVHDKSQPFIVHAGDLKIKVLGTKFTVNATSIFPQITATLLEGSIEVSNGTDHELMKPNQQLTYNVSSKKISLANLTNATREIRWIQNIWVLSDTPLLDICQQLERLFNVKIIVMNDALIDKSFTGEFYTNEPLESILKTMQISTSFNYERKGKNIILR